MSRERRQGTIRGLIWIASGLFAVAVLAIGLTVWGFRADAIDEATNDVNNIAIILAEQTARSVQAVDQTLSELQHIAALAGGNANEIRRALATRQTHELLKARAAQLPQAAVITLADARAISSPPRAAGRPRRSTFPIGISSARPGSIRRSASRSALRLPAGCRVRRPSSSPSHCGARTALPARRSSASS